MNEILRKLREAGIHDGRLVGEQAVIPLGGDEVVIDPAGICYDYGYFVGLSNRQDIPIIGPEPLENVVGIVLDLARWRGLTIRNTIRAWGEARVPHPKDPQNIGFSFTPDEWLQSHPGEVVVGPVEKPMSLWALIDGEIQRVVVTPPPSNSWYDSDSTPVQLMPLWCRLAMHQAGFYVLRNLCR